MIGFPGGGGGKFTTHLDRSLVLIYIVVNYLPKQSSQTCKDALSVPMEPLDLEIFALTHATSCVEIMKGMISKSSA